MPLLTSSICRTCSLTYDLLNFIRNSGVRLSIVNSSSDPPKFFASSIASTPYLLSHPVPIFLWHLDDILSDISISEELSQTKYYLYSRIGNLSFDQLTNHGRMYADSHRSPKPAKSMSPSFSVDIPDEPWCIKLVFTFYWVVFSF